MTSNATKDNPITVVLSNELKSITFMYNGQEVDAGTVLTALSTGMLIVNFSQEIGTYGSDLTLTGVGKYIKSQTWTLAPKEERQKSQNE